jgi:hypothetical protein
VGKLDDAIRAERERIALAANAARRDHNEAVAAAAHAASQAAAASADLRELLRASLIRLKATGRHDNLVFLRRAHWLDTPLVVRTETDWGVGYALPRHRKLKYAAGRVKPIWRIDSGTKHVIDEGDRGVMVKWVLVLHQDCQLSKISLTPHDYLGSPEILDSGDIAVISRDAVTNFEPLVRDAAEVQDWTTLLAAAVVRYGG